MRWPRRSPGRRHLRIAALAAGAWLVVATPAAAQEGAQADTAAVPDTVISPAVAPDTMVGELPGELVGVLADSAAADSTFAVLADPLAPDPAEVTGHVVMWDRERIRRSNATHLGELLAEMVPGTLALRAGFFAGPYHLLDGPFGPTSLEIRVDGRPLAPLIGAQPDLSRILLGMIDEVRVRRTAAGLRVDLTTVRRTDPRAYSRIEAGSGDPGLESLRLVFTNGFGRDFTATAGFELLQSGSPEADIQGFSGGLAWLPGGGTSGVELQFEQRSFERTLAASESGSRSRLVLGGRVGLTGALQAGAWIGESKRELDDASGESEQATASKDLTHGGVELRGRWDRAWATLGGRFAGGEALPDREFEAEGGVRPLSWLRISAGGRLGSIDDLDISEGRLAVEGRLDIFGAATRIHAEAGGGTRGVSYFASDSLGADTLGFSALAAGAETELGSFRLGGRLARQRVDRQLAFGTGFDPTGGVRSGAEVTSFEGTVDLPVLPLSWLLKEADPLRVRGFFRHNSVAAGDTALYVPANVLRGQLYFEDDFLEGDLGVRLGLGIDRRDPWLTAPGADGGEAPTAVPSRTSWDFDLGLRIVGVLIFWRYDNIPGRLQSDLPGFEFPLRRQVFGVRWWFFD